MNANANTNVKTMTLRSAALRAILIAAVAAAAFPLSGFAAPDDCGLAPLLEKRAAAMQRYMFSSVKNEQELFSNLAEVETYPALSDDYRSSLSVSDADADRVMNIKIDSVDCEARTMSYGIYTVNIKWYMSGYDGYYTENVLYKIRTRIMNGRQYIAEFKVLQVQTR